MVTQLRAPLNTLNTIVLPVMYGNHDAERRYSFEKKWKYSFLSGLIFILVLSTLRRSVTPGGRDCKLFIDGSKKVANSRRKKRPNLRHPLNSSVPYRRDAHEGFHRGWH